MKKKSSYIIIVIVLLLIVALSLTHHFLTTTKLNDTAVNGNTAGNLYNRGLLCEYNGTVYFANPADGFTLYSMTPDEKEVKKLNNDVVTYLNADEHYLYYARNNLEKNTDAKDIFEMMHWNSNSLCRTKHNGKQLTILDSAASMYPSLLGNYLYYIHYDTKTASTLYKVKIDGSEKEQVDETPYFTCAAQGSTFYCNGLEKDHYLYAFNTPSDTQTPLYKDDCWMPVVDGQIAYFMDVSDNYRLARVDLNTLEKRTLTKDRIDCFNVSGGYIYYSRNNEPALCRMKLDGSNPEILFSGSCTDINVTSRYVYFRAFDNPSTYYCIPTSGAPEIRIFEPKEQ